MTSMSRPDKAALFDGFATVAKALANGRRAELVDVLAQRERSVDGLAHEVDHSLANTSQHLQVLARAGLVATRRDGNQVLYRLASTAVDELSSSIRDVAAEHVAGFDRLASNYLGDRSGVEEVEQVEVPSRLRPG